MKRMFKAGDKVRHVSGGPVMTVLKYPTTYSLFVGWHHSDSLVECSWYDIKKGYQKEVFNQRNLIRVNKVPTLLLNSINKGPHQESQKLS